MLEAEAILGSCSPGALLANNTPGIDVVLMAMLPFLATTVPAAGAPFPAAGAVPGSLFVACGAALALLLPVVGPLMLRLEAPAAAGPLAIAAESPVDAAPPGGAID